MKKSLTVIIVLLACSTSGIKAQSSLPDDLDFSPFQTVYKSEIELCRNVDQDAVSLHCIQNNMRRDWMEGKPQAVQITKAGGVRFGNDNITVWTPSSKRSNYKQRQYRQKQVRDAERATFFERRRAERLEAARLAHRREMERKRRERMEDNRRAAVAEAATNIALQGATNQRMTNDRWHATEGRRQVQAVARQAVGKPKGMQRYQVPTTSKPKSSGTQLATNLRRNATLNRQRAPRMGGIEYYSRRPAPPVVRQKPNTSGKYVFTGRATKSQIFIKRDPRFVTTSNLNGPKYANSDTQFRLNPNATVTTGQDWHSDDLKFLKKYPPRPLSAQRRDEIERQLKLDELLPDVHQNR